MSIPSTGAGKRSRRMISVAAACDRLGESRSQFYRGTIYEVLTYLLGRSRKVDEDSVEQVSVGKRAVVVGAN